ncbi:MAG: endonuclease domain-containing protein [Phenylobacterium sp.]|nr:endonuclease domain-containing protein [Phenylobacterium sp.]
MRALTLTTKRAKALRRSMTEPEVMLWSRLRRRLTNVPAFRRQHPLGPYILDFFCPSAGLVVEIDGQGHGESEQIAHDQRRDRFLEARGLIVRRIPASSVYQNADEVADGLRILASSMTGMRP